MFNDQKFYFLVVSDCSRQVYCYGTLLISCLGGFFVSVTGFQAQNVLTPTSWLTLNNLSKIPAIVLSCYFWNVTLGSVELSGLSLSLTAGYLYALSRQDLIPRRVRVIIVVLCLIFVCVINTYIMQFSIWLPMSESERPVTIYNSSHWWYPLAMGSVSFPITPLSF